MNTFIFVVCWTAAAIAGAILVSRLIYKRKQYAYRSYSFPAYPEIKWTQGKDIFSNFCIMIPTGAIKDANGNPIKAIDYSLEPKWEGNAPKFEIITNRTKKPAD